MNNSIISTHVYGPSVTHATTNYSGDGLDWRLSYSFGKKTLFVRCDLSLTISVPPWTGLMQCLLASRVPRKADLDSAS